MCAKASPRSLCACRSAMAGFALSRPETSYLLFHFPAHRWQTKRPGGRAMTETLASIDRLHFGVFGFRASWGGNWLIFKLTYRGQSYGTVRPVSRVSVHQVSKLRLLLRQRAQIALCP